MKFKRKSRTALSIPTASMADIAFLLLIFFMVSTVFVRYRGIKLILPSAETTQQIKFRRNLTHIWIGRDGTISIDDQVAVDPTDPTADLAPVRTMIHRKLTENPRVIVSLKCDRNAPYGILSDVLQELRRIEALRINFATEREKT